jgi:hypothetical protein
MLALKSCRDLPGGPRMALASADCRKPPGEHTHSAAPAKTRFCDAVLRNGIVAQIVPLPYLAVSRNGGSPGAQ